MAPGMFKRRCRACYGQKKGCEGGDPCEYCKSKNIPCIQHIGTRERKHQMIQDMEDCRESTPSERPAKRRKTEKRTAKTPARKTSEDDEVLATTTYEVPVLVKNNGSWVLRAELQYTKHAKYTCCTNISATFLLIDEEGDSIDIGGLKSAIIDRTDDAWTVELLDPKECSRQLLIMHDQRNRSRVGEMNRVFQLIFNEDGQVREDETLQREVDHLESDKVHYVNTFKVSAQLRSTGLGEAALTLYHFAITRGPLAFSGYSILSPAALNEEYDPYVKQMLAEKKVPKSYLEVEDALIKFYAKLLYYVVVFGDRVHGGGAITVVARTLCPKLAEIELELLKESMSAQLPVPESIVMIDGQTRRNYLKRLHHCKVQFLEYGRALKAQFTQMEEVTRLHELDPQYNRRRPQVVVLDSPNPMPYDETAWYHSMAMAICTLSTDPPPAVHSENEVAGLSKLDTL